MTLSVTPQASPLGAKLVEETNATATIEANVTGGAGALYMVEVDNPNAGPIWLKLFDNPTPTLGTTPADWVFKIAATTRRAIAMPLGQAFTALSFAVTSAADQGSVAAPALGVLVRLVTT